MKRFREETQTYALNHNGWCELGLRGKLRFSSLAKEWPGGISEARGISLRRRDSRMDECSNEQFLLSWRRRDIPSSVLPATYLSAVFGKELHKKEASRPRRSKWGIPVAETRTSPHEEVDSDVTATSDVIACFDFDDDVTRGSWRKERGKLYQHVNFSGFSARYGETRRSHNRHAVRPRSEWRHSRSGSHGYIPPPSGQ